MHWPSFLAGLLVLPAFVLFAVVTQSVLLTLRRRRSNYLDSATPVARTAEPLEFTSRVMGRIRRTGHGRPRRSDNSASAS